MMTKQIPRLLLARVGNEVQKTDLRNSADIQTEINLAVNNANSVYGELESLLLEGYRVI